MPEGKISIEQAARRALARYEAEDQGGLKTRDGLAWAMANDLREGLPSLAETPVADGEALSLDLSTFGVGAAWPFERVMFQVTHELKIDPTYFLLLLAAAVVAGADVGEQIKFADCLETMKALADAAGVDISSMEVVVSEEGKPS